MTPLEVIENMEKADIFMMTSDFNEGWGAVVNEAMSTGCAVLISSALGCAKYLVSDKENGFIYQFGNQKDMNDKLYLMATDHKLRKEAGKNAFKTISSEYNQTVAVKRLMEFIGSGNSKVKEYESGPLSLAPVTKNNWYKV